jgi:hypothetical protein
MKTFIVACLAVLLTDTPPPIVNHEPTFAVSTSSVAADAVRVDWTLINGAPPWTNIGGVTLQFSVASDGRIIANETRVAVGPSLRDESFITFLAPIDVWNHGLTAVVQRVDTGEHRSDFAPLVYGFGHLKPGV